MEARKVVAGHGWLWIKQGFALFLRSPIMWVVLTILGIFSLFTLAAVPVIGDPLATLLFPTLLAGYMLGCAALERGDELELPHLLAGFRHNTQHLVTLGGVNLVGQLLIFGVMMLTGGAALVAIMMSGSPVDDPKVVAEAVAGAGLAIFIGMGLFGVLLMAGQFAPMLVVFDNVPPLVAMRASLRACVHNLPALTLYGVVMVLFALVASMLAMLGWIVLLPLMLTSLYAAYRDLFPPLTVAANESAGESLPPAEAAPPTPSVDGEPPAPRDPPA